MIASEKTILITGIVGGLARLAAKRLGQEGFEIVGVDYRAPRSPFDFNASIYQANYNKTKIEDIFRRHRPQHILHLGRVGNLKKDLNKRFDLNVIGSRKLMDLALRYGAKRMVVLSTFHIYGAHPFNHIPIYEDEPLRAGTDFPELADAIQLDNQAVAWMYQHPGCRTAILRPTNVVGPDIRNAMSQALRAKRVPVMMGFDPMVQFVHQDDLVGALLEVLRSDKIGVFNVASSGAVPWRKALRTLGVQPVPVPSTVAINYLKMARLVSRQLPPYLMNFFKYPCIISSDAIQKAFDWRPDHDQLETLQSLR